MVDLDKIKKSSRAMRALTGMTASEFEELETAFAKAERALADHSVTARGTQRKRRLGAGTKPVLPGPAERLLFIMLYFKVYPTQDVLAVLFGQSQPWANKWTAILMPVLEKALGKKLVLPQRPAVNSIRQLKQVCPELLYIIDATERPIYRPRNAKLQREFYSGKKKRHVVKNTVVTSGRDGRVVYLGGTHSGRIHDKKAVEADGLRWPKGSVTFADSGYQGYDPPGVVVLRPKKKKRGSALSARVKHSNKRLSSARVAVEHSLSGVKRSRIVHDIYRNRRPGGVDRVMLIASGLHNFRIDHRPLRK